MRLTGVAHGEVLVVSVLMNTRGLTETVVLSVALDVRLIDQDFYSMMVVMAVFATATTGPLLRLIRRRVPDPAALDDPSGSALELTRTE